MNEDEINIVKSFLLGFQDQLCDRFESIDGCSSFRADKWKRESGGGGESGHGCLLFGEPSCGQS